MKPTIEILIPHLLPDEAKYLSDAREAAAEEAKQEVEKDIKRLMPFAQSMIRFDPTALVMKCVAKSAKATGYDPRQLEVDADAIVQAAVARVLSRINNQGVLANGSDVYRALAEVRLGGSPPTAYRLILDMEPRWVRVLTEHGWTRKDDRVTKTVAAADYKTEVVWLQTNSFIP